MTTAAELLETIKRVAVDHGSNNSTFLDIAHLAGQALAALKQREGMDGQLKIESASLLCRVEELRGIALRITNRVDDLSAPAEPLCESDRVVGGSGSDSGEIDNGTNVFVLTDSHVNNLQISTIQTMIDRAKHAHYCNVYLRINGKDELYEADWIKCLSGPPLAKPATDLTPQRDRKWYDEGTPSDDADVNAKG